MKKVLIITIVILTILAIFAAGCVSETNPGSQDKQHIKVWAWDTAVTSAKEAADTYAKINPNVVVDVVDLERVDLLEKVRAWLTEGVNPISLLEKVRAWLTEGVNPISLPDVVFVEDYDLYGYLLNYPDAFVDMTDSISPDNFAKYKLNTMMYNNRLYGVPYDSGVTGLFYREDVINAAGLTDADMQDLTWDKFIELGKIVKEKTGYSMLPISLEGNMECRLIMQSCGDWYVKEDGKTLNINDNKGLKAALETISSMYKEGIVYDAQSWADYVDAINNDKVCCVVGACWMSAFIKGEPSQSGKWRLAKIPRVASLENGTSYSNVGGSCWCVLNNEKKDISVDFLKNTFGSNVELINTLVEKADVISPLITAKDAPNYQKADEFFGGMKIKSMLLDWTEKIPAVTYGYQTYAIDAIVSEKLRSILKGKKISDAIGEINTEASKIAL